VVPSDIGGCAIKYFYHFVLIGLLTPFPIPVKMPLAVRLQRILGTRQAYLVLIALNVLVTLGIMWATRNVILSDTWSYLGLAEGILNGEYSMWWSLDGEYPDTFRAPGYPLFIAAIMSVFGTWKAVIGVQFVLYWVALYFTLRTIARFDPRLVARNLFLLFLLPMVNVPYYVAQVYTEIPVLAALSVVLFLVMRPGRWSILVSIVLGLLFGFIFQCKPVFLLFPLLFSVTAFLLEKRGSDFRGHGVMLVTFFVTLLPFGFWNLRHHGVFKVTPVQGGGGYMHFSYWCGKMPAYTDHISLRNFTGDELIRFTPEDSVPGNIAAFEKEWAGINAQLDLLLTAKDSAMFRAREGMKYPAENTFNSQYAMLQEKLLMQKGLEHMWNDPVYTLAYKSYSAVRLWVIGIQRGDYASASMGGKVQMLYATASTGVMFLLSLVLLPLAYRRGVIGLRGTWPMLLSLVYVGVFHIPFTIQARYTTCVRFAMFALLAMAITGLLWGKREPTNPDRG